MAAKHDTSVELLLLGPPGVNTVKPGETLRASGTFTPQNNFPNAITQILLYIGARGSLGKDVFQLFNTTPGTDPKQQTFEIEYTVPQDFQGDGKSIAILEIGWDYEMQYTWDDALKVFKEKGEESNLLLSFPVAQPSEGKHDFKVAVVTPLPKTVKVGDTLVLDLATQMQSNYPNAISQLIVYVKYGTGTYFICCVQNEIPGERPPLLRGEVSYLVPEGLVGQTLEIGWAFELQYTIQDAINTFNKNPKENLLGSVEVRAMYLN